MQSAAYFMSAFGVISQIPRVRGRAALRDSAQYLIFSSRQMQV